MECEAFILAGAGVIGFFVGSLTGIFGVGGGFLMTPALMIILGVPGHVAVGTDLAVIFTNSSVGIITRRGSGTIDLKLALTIAGGSVVGVLIGSQILNWLKEAPEFTILGREQNPLQYCLLILFLIVLAWIAFYVYYDYRKTSGIAPAKRVGILAGVKIPPFMTFSSLEEPRLAVLPLLVLGVLVGILTGLMGIGGGVIMLPVLIYLVGQRTIKAAGTSLVLIWVSSLVAVIHKAPEGHISLCLLIALLAGGVAGTFIGTKVGLKLSGPRIRLYFVYVVLAAIFLVAYKLQILTF